MSGQFEIVPWKNMQIEDEEEVCINTQHGPGVGVKGGWFDKWIFVKTYVTLSSSLFLFLVFIFFKIYFFESQTQILADQ